MFFLLLIFPRKYVVVFFRRFFCPKTNRILFSGNFQIFENSENFQKKVGNFFPTKIFGEKIIFSRKKIKKTYSGVKHIQRRASNSFSALRTTCLKLDRVFNAFLPKMSGFFLSLVGYNVLATMANAFFQTTVTMSLLQWQKHVLRRRHMSLLQWQKYFPRRLLLVLATMKKHFPRRLLECPCYNDKRVSPDDCHNVLVIAPRRLNNRLGKYFCHCNKKIEQSSGKMFLLSDCSKRIMTVIWGNSFTGPL